MAKFRTDLGAVLDKALSQIDAMQEPLARRIGAAGGRVFRDEAKEKAPIAEAAMSFPTGDRARPVGTLKDSIYLAYRDRESGKDKAAFRYRVSWNRQMAWYAHMVEFGHRQPYVVERNEDGTYWTDTNRKLTVPLWVPGVSFLGSSFYSAREQAKSEMISVGIVESRKLLQEAAEK